MRVLLLLASLLAVGLGLAWLSDGPTTVSGAIDVTADAADAVEARDPRSLRSPEPEIDLGAESPITERREVPATAPRVNAVNATAPEEVDAQPRELRIEGTLTVVDAGTGRRLETYREGVMKVSSIPRADDYAKPIPVLVRNGRWAATVPPGKFIRVRDVVVGKREALAWPITYRSAPPEPIPIPADLRVDIVVALPSEAPLHVLDAWGRPAEKISVKVGSNPFRTNHLHVEQRGASSPIDLARIPRDRPGPVWVWAPDHAWKQVPSNAPSGGERVVRLEAAGHLEVRATGSENLRGRVELSLHRSEADYREWGSLGMDLPPGSRLGPALFRDPVGLSKLSYRSIPTGRFTILVMFDDAVIHSGEVNIAMGQRTVHEVALATPDAPDPELLPLGGTLRVSPEWGSFTLMVTAEGERVADAQLAPVDEGAGLWRWSAGARPAVQHRAHVAGPDVTFVVGVQPNDNHLDVPDPAHVSLTLSTPSGERIADFERLFWGAPFGGSLGFGGTIEPMGDHLEFTAPSGEIRISGSDPRFNRIRNERFLLAPGPNRIDIEIKRSYGFTVTLRCSGSIVAPAYPSMAWVRTPDGEDVEVPGATIDGSRWIVDVPEPGRYRIEFWNRPPEGYTLREPVLAEVREGERVEVMLELERNF